MAIPVRTPCQTMCMVSHFKIILCLLFRALREEGTSLGLQLDGLSIARKYMPQGDLMTHTFTKYVPSRGRFWGNFCNAHECMYLKFDTDFNIWYQLLFKKHKRLLVGGLFEEKNVHIYIFKDRFRYCYYYPWSCHDQSLSHHQALH